MYKKYTNEQAMLRRHIHNILLVMRLITILLIIPLVQVSAASLAQRITLSEKNAPLVQVFKQIRSQSGYDFVFTTTTLKGAHPVSIEVEDAAIETVLKEIFKDQPLEYTIGEKAVVIKRREKPTLKKVPLLQDTIRGTVTDSLGRPLAGVAVRIAGTRMGTNTNGKGQFTIPNSIDGAQVEFFHIGFAPLRLPSTNLPVNIVLQESVSKLDETVVIAYGTTTQRLNTGSVSSVTSVDIENQPVSNPLSAIQGRVPGLVISQTSGVPGSSFRVQLRGQSSLDLSLSQNDPLFIIDGVPFESGNTATNQIYNAANNPTSISQGGLSPLNILNPASIERIDVLKDADATAIYGSRGANGVILITTKKGKLSETAVSINGYSGISTVGRTMDMLNTQQYVAMRKEAFANDGIEMTTSNAPDIMLWDTTRYTDFKKLLIGNNASANSLNASISGGANRTSFRIGAGYRRETSVFSSTNANSIASATFNINHRNANDRLEISFNGNIGNDRSTLAGQDLTQYISLPPNLKLYNEDGSYAWEDGGVIYNTLGSITNPLADFLQQYSSNSDNVNLNVLLSYKILKGLQIKLNSGYNKFNINESRQNPSTSLDPFNVVTANAYFANAYNKNWIVEPHLQYSGAFGKHEITVLTGGTFQNRTNEGNYSYASGYSSDILLGSLAAAGAISASNSFAQYKYAAAFGRVTYDYDKRYLINLTGRRDGSSRFGPGKQWANFGAIGVAWLFTNEHFLSNLENVFSYGKIRASYGTTGNDQIGNYRYLDLWRNSTSSYDGIVGLYSNTAFNPNYQWEINKKLELGLELGFLSDKLLLTANYFRNRSSNQLINYSISSQTGFNTVIRNFPALVQNQGLEAVFSTVQIPLGKIKWSGSLNITIPQNKLLSFPNLENSSYSSKYVLGKSLSLFQGYSYIGVNPETGVYEFEDLDGDGEVYDVGDQKAHFDLDPDYYGGMQNSFAFKNWNLSFFFQFTKQLGSNYTNGFTNPPGFLNNVPSIALERWQQQGDITETQKFTSTYTPVFSAHSTLRLSNGAYTDASFLRLKNVALSYNLPAGIIRPLHLKGLRLYAEAQNLWTITGYKGTDPETQNFYILPPLKTITGGVQIDL